MGQKRKPRCRNPVTGEYWIDDRGNAEYADGDVGDKNHEMIVMERLAATFLSAMDIEVDGEMIGRLQDYERERSAPGAWKRAASKMTRRATTPRRTPSGSPRTPRRWS